MMETSTSTTQGCLRDDFHSVSGEAQVGIQAVTSLADGPAHLATSPGSCPNLAPPQKGGGMDGDGPGHPGAAGLTLLMRWPVLPSFGLLCPPGRQRTLLSWVTSPGATWREMMGRKEKQNSLTLHAYSVPATVLKKVYTLLSNPQTVFFNPQTFVRLCHPLMRKENKDYRG